MKLTYLRVQTSHLEEQRHFYNHTLGLPLSDRTDHGFSVQIGYSLLEFHQSENPNPYHIAFHIGAHQEEEALEWLEKRVKILENEGNHIVDFLAWNAKSIYFYDSDRNIIEFISRKHLYPTTTSFSEKSLIGIAEIGLATKDVAENFRFLNQYFNLEVYFGSPEVFCAIGDENGLLITVDQDEKTWFPTNDSALPGDFDVKFERRGKHIELVYEEGKLSVM